MTDTNWQPVATALLGSWPTQVASWGREGIAAYLSELQARGLTPESALVALRSCGGEHRFPPSAPELAALERFDPSRPTPEEAYQMIYGRGGVMRARAKPGGSYANEAAMIGAGEDAKVQRAFELHPLLGAFVERYGIRRLSLLEVDHPDYGEIKRRELREAWMRHLEAFEGREVAAIARGRTEGLGRLDPFAALGIERKALGSGEAV